MSEWWTYRLSDFLMFSPDIYWRLVERYQQALWPLPWVLTVVGLALMLLAASHRRWAPGVVLLVLAVLWAWVGWAFHWQRHAQINWVAQYLAAAFWLQAALLGRAAWQAHASNSTGLAAPAWRWSTGGGLALAGMGVVGYPALALLQGLPLARAEVFGLMPEPTALATLGLLLVLRAHAAPWMGAIPVLSLLFAAAMLWAMHGV